jgi:hypothetical protein
MLYFLFFILTLLWHFFWVDIFHFLCDRRSVINSKVHYKFINFLEFIQKIYDGFN